MSYFLNHAIMVVGVAGLNAPHQALRDRLAVHEGTYEVLKAAFTESGIDFGACILEERGDGVLILLPPGTPRAVLADRLPERVVAALRRFNWSRIPQAQIRLQLALGSGEVGHDGTRWLGEAIDTAIKILSSNEAKEAFVESNQMLTVISSKRFFDEIIAPDPGLLPESYNPIHISKTDRTETAYLRLHGKVATVTSTSQYASSPADDDRAKTVAENTAWEVIPRADLTKLQAYVTQLQVPHLAAMVRQALEPVTPSPSLPATTDAWSAFLILSDFNAGPDGIPPAITFLRLLAEQLGDQVGAFITRWIDEQARQLRLIPALSRQQLSRPTTTFHMELHGYDLNEILAHDGPPLASLLEPSPPNAAPADMQGQSPPEFPIWIYLSTATGHELVQAAVEDLVSKAEAEVIERGDPEIGSWMRRLIGRIKTVTETTSGREAAMVAAHAVEARLVQAQDATNTATLMQNLAPTLTALQPIPSAVVRVGALLIVKNGDIIAVHQLTTTQQFQLNHKPELLSSPRDILQALGLNTLEYAENGTDTPILETTPAPLDVATARSDSEPVNYEVGPAWHRITAWLRVNTPATAATLRCPAPTADVLALQHAMRQTLPDDLVEWWRLMDGVDYEQNRRTAFTVPGVFFPLPVARAREAWNSLSTYADQTCCHPEGNHLQPAGKPMTSFCTALIPICRRTDGAILAVDLRPGTERGHVMGWTSRTGTRRTRWRNVNALLTDCARRLENHVPAQTDPAQPGQPMIRDDGVLIWA
ncbi:hypothetical protein AB0J55_38155 [Amycolatopsis sp. NPDC049688]|uniref:hypothetical protein n=1 Tax=Amycolatopsis sp. NPDC049688 TaxID=3154733 RepID=UPI003436C331